MVPGLQTINHSAGCMQVEINVNFALIKSTMAGFNCCLQGAIVDSIKSADHEAHVHMRLTCTHFDSPAFATLPFSLHFLKHPTKVRLETSYKRSINFLKGGCQL